MSGERLEWKKVVEEKLHRREYTRIDRIKALSKIGINGSPITGEIVTAGKHSITECGRNNLFQWYIGA